MFILDKHVLFKNQNFSGKFLFFLEDISLNPGISVLYGTGI